MQPQELRIWNWIMDENDFPMQVVTIGTDYICADFEGNEGDIWEFDFKNNFPKPIKLTEEILLKCGFVKQGFYFLHPDSGLIQIEVSLSRKCFLNSLLAIEIKYFHQLQNIIFCLTGKELEYKQ